MDDDNPAAESPASGVRIGTRVWTHIPEHGKALGGSDSPDTTSLVQVEHIRPGDTIFGEDGKLYPVLHCVIQPYRGSMIGLGHQAVPRLLWVTPGHLILAVLCPRSLGGQADWSGIPLVHRGRSQELRREMTPPERRLWAVLRREALGVKFRRQHPIGPYIVDFYSRDAHLVIEVDGRIAHGSLEQAAYDRDRDAYLQSLGLVVVRIGAAEVDRNLVGVRQVIAAATGAWRQPTRASWVEAGQLIEGDAVVQGSQGMAALLTVVAREFSTEPVFNLLFEGSRSFSTEVCLVQGLDAALSDSANNTSTSV